MIDVEFSYQELLDGLNKLDEDLQGKAISRALTPAVKPITDTMKSIVPMGETMQLKESIGRRQISKRGRERLGIAEPVAIIIGPNRKKKGGRPMGHIGVFLEYGTKHINPREFMQRALEAGEDGMQQRFFEGLQKYLNKITDNP